MVQLISISFIVMVISLIGPALASCNYGTTFSPRAPNGQVPINTFGYTPAIGPMHWFHMNKTANYLCGKGRHQSPINLNKHTKIEIGTDLNFQMENATEGAVFENTGTTVQVLANGTITPGGKLYNLAQFHFHTPSEHKLNDEYYPMEVHFVFEGENKNIAVVTFLINLGPTDPLFQAVFTHIYDIKRPGTATRTEPLDFIALQEKIRKNLIWKYKGSLTTPPCTEGVKWYISQVPLFVNSFTYERVRRVLKFNSRFTQNKPGQANILEQVAMEFIQDQ